jgi:hypothetical protein
VLLTNSYNILESLSIKKLTNADVYSKLSACLHYLAPYLDKAKSVLLLLGRAEGVDWSHLHEGSSRGQSAGC